MGYVGWVLQVAIVEYAILDPTIVAIVPSAWEKSADFECIRFRRSTIAVDDQFLWPGSHDFLVLSCL